MKTLHLLILLWILASIAALAMPIFDLAYLHPALVKLMSHSTERDAERLAQAALGRLPRQPDGEIDFGPAGLRRQLELVRKDLGLLRLGFMDMDGGMVSQVKPGFRPGRPNLLKQVVTSGRGMTRTLRVSLETPSDGQVSADVMVLTLPVIEGGFQIGALEVVYDWTEQRSKLTELVQRSTLFLLFIPAFFLFVVGYVSRQSYRAVHAQSVAQERLAESQKMLQAKHQELTDLFQQIEVAKEEWQISMDCIDDMVLLVDKDNLIRRCNEAFRRLVGTGYAELLGKNWRKVLFTPEMEVVSMSASSFQLYHKPTSRWLDLNFYPYKDRAENGPDWTVITINVREEGDARLPSEKATEKE